MPAQRKFSARQTEVLLSFMESNKDVAKGRVSQEGGPLGKQNFDTKWDQLAEMLNCVGNGATKSPREWRIYWNNLKYKVRAKFNLRKKHMDDTQGGFNWEQAYLTNEEWRIMNIQGDSVLGDISVPIPSADEGPEPKPKKICLDNFTIVKNCCVNLVKKHGRSVTLFDDLAFRELIDLIPMTQSEKQTLTSQYIQTLLDDDQLADVKKHGRSVTLFDDLAFRELIDLIPMTQSEKQTLTSQYIQTLLDDDQLADVKKHGRSVTLFDDLVFRELIDLIPITQSEKQTLTSQYIQTLLDDDQLADETMDKTTDDITAADDDNNDDSHIQVIKAEVEAILCTCGKDNDESMPRHTVECPASSQQTYWNFFEVSLDGATCQICNETITSTEISTLKDHLQNTHPSVDFVDAGEEFEKGPPSEDGSTNDFGMEEVYLDETVSESEQTASAAKRRRKRAKAALNITGPITRENIALSLLRFKSLDSFGQYVASLMKLIPKDKCIKLQIQIVERLLQEQAAAG